ncbi:MAG: hypothetical protein AB7G93_13645 [Bdellovibrionales bacterium]
MKRNFWRVFAALVISAGIFLGTRHWYISSQPKHIDSHHKPVARLSESVNEVQRKPVKRVIWENITRNEELYAGEAVRTSPDSEAKLLFLKTGTLIHLEPDSLVVLEENAEGLSLDFLQGNLFVESGGQTPGAAAGGLTLKTGSGEIKLQSGTEEGKASLALSRDQKGRVNLEVFAGKAQLQQGSKTVSLEKDKATVLTEKGVSAVSERMQLRFPAAGDTILLNLERGERFEPSWEPLPLGYVVTAEIGPTRSRLTPVKGAEAHGEKGKLGFQQKPGKWYLRLTARSTDPARPPLMSLVTPFEIQPKTPPSLLEPKHQSVMLKKTPEEDVQFSWLNRHTFLSQVLEVATDAQFRNTIARANLKSGETAYSASLKDGPYFWRVTGYMETKGKPEPLSSPAAQFTVSSSWEIKPARLLLPANNSSIPFAEAQKDGITFQWEASPGVARYEILVRKQAGEQWKSVFEKQTVANLSRVVRVTPGLYEWHVVSLDSKETKGKLSDTFRFTVEDQPQIEWVRSEPRVEYEFTTPTPSLRAEWKPVSGSVASYRFRVKPTESVSDSEVRWTTTKQTMFDIPLPAEGAYESVVEAVNSKGQVIAQSAPKVFEVKRRPLLPPPQWLAQTPDVLKSDARGNLTFGWEQVEGADHYLLIVENSQGQLLQRTTVERNTASLKRLKPGQYQVRVQSVDALKRPGPNGEVKKIEVPDTSDIRAPKIKALKVK